MLAVLMLNRMTMRRRNLRAKETAFKAEKKPDTQSVYCRTCLSAEDLVAIFFNPGMEKKRTDELRLVTGLEIMRNDGLSQKICSNCVEKINSALRFRKQSKKAEKSLLNMSLGLKPKKKSISKISRKTVKVKSPKVQSIKRKVKKVEELDYKSSYDDFQNDCDDMDVPLSDFNEVEEKPKIKQVKSPKMQRIKRKVKKVEELDYKRSYDDFQNDCDDMDLPLSDFNEVEEKPKIERLLKKPGVRKRLSIPNAASYKCGTCSKEFRMKATFKAHMRFHTNYCVCEACGKRCRNNNQLQEHKRARHGLGRIHKCAYCEYSSATKEALTIHERRHTGERPYICDHCGASFHRRSNLVQHIAIHLPEKNFQCDMCPKRLKSRKFLQIHKHNAHTGKRYGYLCPVCAHRFEKPNKCSLCLKREKSKKLLQVHVFKAHREKRYRYICPVCRDTFTRPGNVRQHLARSHGVPRADQPAIDRFQAHSYFSEEVPPRLYSYL